MLTDFDESEKENKIPKTLYDLRCDDTTKEGRWHAHILLYFKNAVSFNTIKKAFPNAHIEKAKDVYDAIGYIKNNQNGRKSIYYEQGTEPKNTRFATVGELKEIKNVDEIPWNCFKTWQALHEAEEIDVEEWHKDVEVFYIFGPSGVGKTECAKELIRMNKDKYGTKLSLVKFDGNFWHGVKNDGVIAVYDDFRDSHMKPSEFINFIDYNIQLMNIKGGTVKNNYKLIIISSVQPINEIYRNITGEPREQWMRRIKTIDLTENETSSTSDDEIDIDALI